jgi:hypothetical protein
MTPDFFPLDSTNRKVHLLHRGALNCDAYECLSFNYAVLLAPWSFDFVVDLHCNLGPKNLYSSVVYDIFQQYLRNW